MKHYNTQLQKCAKDGDVDNYINEHTPGPIDDKSFCLAYQHKVSHDWNDAAARFFAWAFFRANDMGWFVHSKLVKTLPENLTPERISGLFLNRFYDLKSSWEQSENAKPAEQRAGELRKRRRDRRRNTVCI